MTYRVNIYLDELRKMNVVPSSDGRQPKYRWVLLSADGSDWLSSTENEEEAIPAYARMIELGAASEVVEVIQ